MRNKIIIIALVIATITAAFCIGANAIEYPQTLVLHTGEVIEWNETPNVSGSQRTANIEIISNNGTYYNSIKVGSGFISYMQDRDGAGTGITAYGSGSGWSNDSCRIMTIRTDTTITDSNMIQTLYNNTIRAPWIDPPSPHAQEISEILGDSKSVFATALTAATLIITWLAANQICLCGLYLFILVAVGGVCKRFVKGS